MQINAYVFLCLFSFYTVLPNFLLLQRLLLGWFPRGEPYIKDLFDILIKQELCFLVEHLFPGVQTDSHYIYIVYYYKLHIIIIILFQTLWLTTLVRLMVRFYA